MWRKLASLGKTIFRRSRLEGDMAEELRCHIEERADHLVLEGMERQEALRQARLEFGAVEAYKEECRAARGARWMDELWRNLRYAGRSLHKRPGYAAIAIVSLALGIGGNVSDQPGCLFFNQHLERFLHFELAFMGLGITHILKHVL